jgi:hypothetical protein
MQFLHLGDRSGGSHGLSADQSDMAKVDEVARRQKIDRRVQPQGRPAALADERPRPKKYRPKLKAGNPTEESMEVLGQFLGHLADADILFADDPALKDTVLDRAGLRSSRRVFRDVPSKPRPIEGPPGAQPAVTPPKVDAQPGAKKVPAGGKAVAQRVRKPSG